MPELRLARAADARAIAELSRDLIERGLGWTWHRGRVLRSIHARETNVLVATEDNHIIGFAIMEYGNTRAHLSLLGVHPAHQGRGLGRRLLLWLEEAALMAGIRDITLELRESNHRARRFYRQLGFKEIRYVPGYYRGIETAIQMTRNIVRRTSPSEPTQK